MSSRFIVLVCVLQRVFIFLLSDDDSIAVIICFAPCCFLNVPLLQH